MNPPPAAPETLPLDPRSEASMRREIGPLLGVALVVNATIGTGIFKTPAKVVRLAGSTEASLAVWVAGAVIALCGALTLAELAVFRLRAKEPGLARPFRVPLFPLPPLVFLVGAGVLLWGASRDVDHNAAIAFGVVLAGVPVGWLWHRGRR